MKVLLITDGSGSELQVHSDHKEFAILKIYTDISGGLDSHQSIALNVDDMKYLIKELKRIHYDLS